VSSGWLGVIERALEEESDLSVVRGISSVRGGRLCGLEYPRWRNRCVNSTCLVSCVLLLKKELTFRRRYTPEGDKRIYEAPRHAVPSDPVR
jgi:hypothetical protein